MACTTGPSGRCSSSRARGGGTAADGNGDGRTDPHNVYDAALAAGRYLCTAAGRMGDDASLTWAYLSYNHSDTYAANVLYLAREYEARDCRRLSDPLVPGSASAARSARPALVDPPA